VEAAYGRALGVRGMVRPASCSRPAGVSPVRSAPERRLAGLGSLATPRGLTGVSNVLFCRGKSAGRSVNGIDGEPAKGMPRPAGPSKRTGRRMVLRAAVPLSVRPERAFQRPIAGPRVVERLLRTPSRTESDWYAARPVGLQINLLVLGSGRDVG
jgi:hypothetical protein